MSISRRTLIRQLLVVAGGVTLIPSCVNRDQSGTAQRYNGLNIAAADEKMLAELAETILPATDTPGAKDLYLHEFALTMMKDCHSPEAQQKFTTGLSAFNEYVRQQQNASFTELDANARLALLQRIEAKTDVPQEVQEFYQKSKNLFIHGYLTSEHYLTKVQVYELVPGRYLGCVPVKVA